MNKKKMINRGAENSRLLSPLQIGLFIAVFLLALGAEVLVMRAYANSGESAAEVSQASYVITNLANIQREILLLQSQTVQAINDGGQDTEPLTLRRTLLDNQLQIMSAGVSDNPQVAARMRGIQKRLDQYDGMLASFIANSTLEGSAAGSQLIDILSNLEREVKSFYDKEEQGFFSATSEEIRAQRNSQILSLTVGVLVLVSVVILGISVRRSLLDLWKEMTERRRAERDMEQARDIALQASQAKSQFLASMSHEIRTPMNAIIGMAELLSESQLSPEQHEYLRVAKAAGESLLSLINDILDLSKVESGQLVLEQIDFELDELAESAVEALAVAAHEKGLELNCRISPDVPLSLVGDPGRLNQVLTNLLANAIKFTDHGEVSLEVESDPDSGETGAIQFRVSDTGIGIPHEKLEAIFDSFTQVDASITRRYGGTGLGLSIALQLTGLMKGHIWAESELGRGSTFYFSVQFQYRDTPKREGVSTSDALNGLKVLVVDDNAGNQLILKELLSEWGAVVTTAGSGCQALAHLARAKNEGAAYRLVLLDSRMPGMDGFQVVEHIKDDANLVGTAIMMLTSDNRKEDVPRCAKLGLAAYLVKPVKRADLLKSISDTIGRLKVLPGEPAPEAAPSAPKCSHSQRILLVDDCKDNTLLVQCYLKSSAYQLDIAENGEVAIEKLMADNYDLVLMDMQMPVMDGYTATKAIRQLEQERHSRQIPIVALTAHALKEDSQKSLDAGCTAHITKPIKKALLLETITQHIGGNSDDSK